MSDARHLIEKMFQQVLEIDSAHLTDDLNAGSIGAWNSLNHIRLIVEVERTFNIQFKPREVVSATNYGQLIALVAKKMEERTTQDG